MSEENPVQKPNTHLLVFACLAVLVAAIGLALVFNKKPFNGLSSSEADALTHKINLLKLGVEVGFFTQQLGEPKLKENKTLRMVSYKVIRHAPPKKEVREVLYTEYYYSNPHFYVQAVANQEGIVEYYSVTARGASFQPKIATGLGEPVELGKTVYQSLKKLPYKVAGRLAAEPKNAAYYEIFVLESKAPKLEIYSTNPSGYIKEAVPLDEKKDGFLVTKITEDMSFPITPVHDNFRKTTTINTYSAAAAEFEGVDASFEGMNYGEAKITFGPREELIEKLQ